MYAMQLLYRIEVKYSMFDIEILLKCKGIFKSFNGTKKLISLHKKSRSKVILIPCDYSHNEIDENDKRKKMT